MLPDGDAGEAQERINQRPFPAPIPDNSNVFDGASRKMAEKNPPYVSNLDSASLIPHKLVEQARRVVSQLRTRKSYARSVVKFTPVRGMPEKEIEVIVGVEFLGTQWYPNARKFARAAAEHAIYRTNLKLCHPSDAELAEEVERMILGAGHELSYFIEIGRDESGWVQVFEP